MNRSIVLLVVAAACSFFTAASPAFAQNTTFTYQGRVLDNGTNFSGTGQFEFALITSTNDPGASQALAMASISAGQVSFISVTTLGSGYYTPPNVVISGGGGSGATATAFVSSGQVFSINIVSPGNGYTFPPTVTIDPPPAVVTNTWWSNDGTSTHGSQPAAGVNVFVTNGLFMVVLGDATQPNMLPINLSVFLQQNLQLEIWFNDGVNGFAALSPIQNLTSTPYADYASLAGNLASVGHENLFAGVGAGVSTNSGFGNTAIGGGALGSNLQGSGNTATGYGALADNLDGTYNTAYGTFSIQNNVNGYYNTAYGFASLQDNLMGSYNSAFGVQALQSNIQGNDNTALGDFALTFNTNGNYNTAVGFEALLFNTIGNGNTTIGFNSLESNVAGNQNVADGNGALQGNVLGNQNTALGYQALSSPTNGNNNVAVGYEALWQLGPNNGTPVGGGSNNIALGYLSGASFIANESSNIDIGNQGVVGENQVIRIGDYQTQAFIAGVITGNGGGLTNLNASQLPAAVVTNTESGVTLSGTFSGDGSGLTGLNAANLTGPIMNSQLANSSLTINAGTGLNGGGTVSLGGSTTLYNAGVTSLTGGGGVTVSASTGSVLLGSTATSSDITNTIVSRDSSGNFSAGSITLYRTLSFVTNIDIGAGFPNNTIGAYNIGIGSGALFANRAGSGNIALGVNAMDNNTYGTNNIAIGQGALLVESQAVGSIAIGNQALQDVMENNMIGIGNQSLLNADFGQADIAIGQETMEYTVNGSYNTAVGYEAMQNLYNLSSDTAVGYQALQGGSTENVFASNGGNTAVGYQALLQTAAADNNTGVGASALLNNTNGMSNTAIGASALYASTNGNFDIALGTSAGSNLKSGDHNIDIGNTGVNGDSGITRIGDVQTQAFIAGVINGNGGGLTNLVTATGYANVYLMASVGGNAVNLNAALPLNRLGATNGWTFNGTSALTNANTGLYLIHFEGWTTAGSANVVQAQINGSPVTGSGTYAVTGQEFSHSFIASLNALDVLQFINAGPSSSMTLNTPNSGGAGQAFTVAITRIK